MLKRKIILMTLALAMGNAQAGWFSKWNFDTTKLNPLLEKLSKNQNSIYAATAAGLLGAAVGYYFSGNKTNVVETEAPATIDASVSTDDEIVSMTTEEAQNQIATLEKTVSRTDTSSRATIEVLEADKKIVKQKLEATAAELAQLVEKNRMYQAEIENQKAENVALKTRNTDLEGLCQILNQRNIQLVKEFDEYKAQVKKDLEEMRANQSKMAEEIGHLDRTNEYDSDISRSFDTVGIEESVAAPAPAMETAVVETVAAAAASAEQLSSEMGMADISKASHEFKNNILKGQAFADRAFILRVAGGKEFAVDPEFDKGIMALYGVNASKAIGRSGNTYKVVKVCEIPNNTMFFGNTEQTTMLCADESGQVNKIACFDTKSGVFTVGNSLCFDDQPVNLSEIDRIQIGRNISDGLLSSLVVKYKGGTSCKFRCTYNASSNSYQLAEAASGK